jgi:hypothetical protein
MLKLGNNERPISCVGLLGVALQLGPLMHRIMDAAQFGIHESVARNRQATSAQLFGFGDSRQK